MVTSLSLALIHHPTEGFQVAIDGTRSRSRSDRYGAAPNATPVRVVSRCRQIRMPCSSLIGHANGTACARGPNGAASAHRSAARGCCAWCLIDSERQGLPHHARRHATVACDSENGRTPMLTDPAAIRRITTTNPGRTSRSRAPANRPSWPEFGSTPDRTVSKLP